ncbi:hypothetical protein COT60_02370 [Candidatus Pacearchaeota archaeon CG09_land_8_20_14_0_10_30_9]|nr:hypothetical protein [Candidatus Pacearchaeota archaeon]OIO40726.1 MAG: hypothetical protein AUJ61_01425 [Candidatus Pacearchaeota archaeon CG1_02_30_18]PIN71324.1 MAG: hypothetical protein COV77_02690 [Candidatus Pacearchaeota archaeon CG11_big_fil_rev_8_21_14_0_20_30_13]PIO01064.1 MAG: hypothetical protein COT60_02370 [Candidatus Pacearchaeota archaeon CG09_land_8_20_14_0_10_30_9]PJA71399.1 MAG: hypothetical protein CO153_01710 [Candidatus Pacearchaeota archaeon CG_4_9_14_3_um_filter_30_11
MIKEKKQTNISKKKEEFENERSENQENKILKMIFLIVGVVFLLIAGIYFYTQSQINFTYKNIEFQKTKIGEIDFYETKTLATADDGSLFGFRLRTKPSVLENIPFENVDELRLMKVNGYTYEDNKTFDCEGDGVIAMANLQRLFSKQGMSVLRDPNSGCDSEGRYNYFTLKYGSATEINEIGLNCYEIVIQGNDAQCQILPATEKLMVELYSRYLSIKQ